MKIEVKSYSNVSSLISSIIFFILGAIMFTKPDVMVVVASRIFGGVLILYGIYNCIKNYTMLKQDSSTTSLTMITGLIAITFGVLFFFLAGVIEAIIRYIIGGWILFSGINRLVMAFYIPNRKSSSFISSLIIAILLILGGLYTILENNLAFKTIGIILMVYSALEIIGWIFNRNVTLENTKKKEKMDKHKKNKNVIDAIVIEDKKSSKK